MNKQIIIGLTTEGETDLRFLESIIKRTFERVAFECPQEVEIFDSMITIPKIPGNITEKALHYARQAEENGAMVLCFHVDADDKTDFSAFNNRINLAFAAIKQSPEELCKNLVAVVPVQMTEAWMLADKELLKKELGTTENDTTLGINKNPEAFANPKQSIEEAIRISRKKLTKRCRSKLSIGELYQPIGQKIELHKLENLSSYQKFENCVRDAFRELNLLPNL